MPSATKDQMIQTAQEFFWDHGGVCRCGGTLYFYGFGSGSEQSLIGAVPEPRRTKTDNGVRLACAEVVCGYKAGYGLTAAGKILKTNPLTKHDEAIIGWLPL